MGENICSYEVRATRIADLPAQAVHAAAGRYLQATHLTQTLDKMLHTLSCVQLRV